MPQKVHLRRALKGPRFYGAECTYRKVQKGVEEVSKDIILQQKPDVRGGYGCYKGRRESYLGFVLPAVTSV